MDGNNLRESYMIAYPSSRKWKDDSINSNASTLFRSEKIQKEYKRRKKLIEEAHAAKLLYTREEAITDLKTIKDLAMEDIQENGFRQANSTAFLNALKELVELEDLDTEKQLKIKKMDKELESTKNAEEKIVDFFDKLNDVMLDG